MFDIHLKVALLSHCRSVLLAQPTDSGQLIATEAIKLFHTMKLDVKDMRGVGLQVQQLEGSHADPTGQGPSRGRSIKDLLLAKQPAHSPKKGPLAEGWCSVIRTEFFKSSAGLSCRVLDLTLIKHLPVTLNTSI